jgi:thiol-disulfide isomerase/thioredoxin
MIQSLPLGRRNWLRLVAVAAILGVVVAGGVLLLGGRDLAATANGPPAFKGAFGSYEPAEDPAPAPDVAFLDANGDTIKLDALRGQIVLLNFWATWCAPCVKELPVLDRLQADLGSEEFRVLLVSVDRKGATVADPFLEDLKLGHLKTAIDSNSDLVRAFGAAGLPTTFLLDREGRVRGRLEGDADWESDAAKDLIRHYLQEG